MLVLRVRFADVWMHLPWVFVVGADGVVLGRFEGLVTPEELRELLA